MHLLFTGPQSFALDLTAMRLSRKGRNLFSSCWQPIPLVPAFTRSEWVCPAILLSAQRSITWPCVCGHFSPIPCSRPLFPGATFGRPFRFHPSTQPSPTPLRTSPQLFPLPEAPWLLQPITAAAAPAASPPLLSFQDPHSSLHPWPPAEPGGLSVRGKNE